MRKRRNVYFALILGIIIGLGLGASIALATTSNAPSLQTGKDQTPDVVVSDLTRVDPGEAWLNVVFRNPVTDEVILSSDLKIDGLDIAAFGDDKHKAIDITKAARASAAILACSRW